MDLAKRGAFLPTDIEGSLRCRSSATLEGGPMLSHQERITAAREGVDYLMGRTTDELTAPIPNCPGWTVYNAAVHVARAALGWAE